MFSFADDADDDVGDSADDDAAEFFNLPKKS